MQASSSSKKSKSGKVVASRYKQSALQKAVSRSNTLTTSNASKGSLPSSESTFLNNTTMAWGGTPGNRRKNDFMSTPAVSHVLAPMCDASAISVDQSFMPLSMESLECPVIKQKIVNASGKTERNVTPVLALPREKKQEDKHGMSQAELNVYAAQYLQAAFLASKAKKALAKKVENSTRDLHGMWLTNRTLMKQKQVLEQARNCIQYVAQMEGFCEEKVEIYDPLTSYFKNVFCRYKQLCSAVSSIKTALSIPNVTFTTAVFSKENLLTAAEECTTLLDMFQTFSSEQKDLPKVADLLVKLNTLQEEIVNVQSQCLELLESVDHLVLEEASTNISKNCLQGI